MPRQPYALIEPPDGDSPVLVEVPHAGLALDAQSLICMASPAHFIARDADLYVDELFADSPEVGATLLCAKMSRYVVDLNRQEDDYDGIAVTGGPPNDRPRGMIWRLTSRGVPVLRQPLSQHELNRRRDLYYRPYHETITRILERKRQRFGFAVMICAHSMPTPDGVRKGVNRNPYPDLVPGSRGRTSADNCWIDLVEEQGKAQGWEVRHDDPYRGAFSTTHYGRPAENWHAVQVELARRLYMDEVTLAHRAVGFATVRSFAKSLVSRFVQDAQSLVSKPVKHERRDVDARAGTS